MLLRLLLFLIFLQSKLSFGINDKDIDIHGDKDWKCLGDIWKLPNSSKILKHNYNPRDASFHVSKDKEIESHYPEGEIPNRVPTVKNGGFMGSICICHPDIMSITLSTVELCSCFTPAHLIHLSINSDAWPSRVRGGTSSHGIHISLKNIP
uniref:Uncharacterized protein n=1 Tax=Ciona savignyi TaxID=51511 RepID=H2YK89_CIOSA